MTTTEAQAMRTVDDIAKRIPAGTRPRGEVRARIAAILTAAYQEGASVRDLAIRSGRSFGFVHRVLHEQARDGKVTIRPRGRLVGSPVGGRNGGR